MAKILSKIEALGILQQSKAVNHWDAVNAANANFKTIQWINADVLIPDPGVTVDQFNVTSQIGIVKEADRFFIDNTSGLVKLPFSGTCDKTTLAAFLVGALQSCTEDAGTPFNKAILALMGVPNWANNEGYLFTLALKQGASADDGILLNNCLIDTLNIVWELESSGVARLVNMNGTWVGSDIKLEQTLNGTWTNGTPLQTGFFNNTDLWGVTLSSALFTIDSVDYSAQCIRRFELQIANNVQKSCISTGGKAANYLWSPTYKIMMTIDHNSVTEKIHKDFVDGANIELYWSNDSAAAATDGKWSIVVENTGSPLSGGVGKLMSIVKGYENGYQVLNLDIEVYRVYNGVPLQMAFCDTVDWGF